jgi:cell division protein ZapA
MSEISVTIAGRAYRMACEDGQEPHLRGLADLVDRSIGEMRARFGEIGDLRLTVMGAIQIADDLGEARRRIAELESEIARMGDAAVARTIAAMAARIDQVSADLADHARQLAGAGADGADTLD